MLKCRDFVLRMCEDVWVCRAAFRKTHRAGLTLTWVATAVLQLLPPAAESKEAGSSAKPLPPDLFQLRGS